MKTKLLIILVLVACSVFSPPVLAMQETTATAPTTTQTQLHTPVVFTKIIAGGSHTCALTANGGVECWGYNAYGQLGDATTIPHGGPVSVSGLGSGIIALTVGTYHTCALTASGGVKCWGYNADGQLGDGTTSNQSTPVDVNGLTSSVVALAAGGRHTCALMATGAVKCWGANTYGQLGDGTTIQRNTPVDVSGLGSGAAALATGGSHTCALMTSGGVKCWGANTYGQLGDGTTIQRNTPVDVIGLGSGITALTAGWSHTCALTTGGGAKCWGYNGYGQLGDGTTTSRNLPVNVIGLGNEVTVLTAGQSHTCALTAGGGAKCWGYNGYGQLGNGSTILSRQPVNVSGLTSGVTALTAGGGHTCALTATTEAKCWGYNASGQLGDGTTTQRSIPLDVSELTSGVTALAAGGRHTCALMANGGVKCWGGNWYGQLGDNSEIQRSTPVSVVGLDSGVTALAAGGDHTCALIAGGAVKCWGNNWYGQVGDGTTNDRNTPMNVSGLSSGIAALDAGSYHTCALTTGGGMKCWGRNNAAQLGDGTTIDRLTPVDVSGLDSGVMAVVTGGAHTCAVMANGGVKCWGDNQYGQLGDGTTTQRNTPVDVSGLDTGVMAVVTGGAHTCALMVGGGTKCWGDNRYGQLGDGTTTQRNTPVDVTGLGSGVMVMAAGGSFTCALMVSGEVKCWGYNAYGQLGDGSVTQRNTPGNVAGLASGVTALAGGGNHAGAVVNGQRPKCWGLDSWGQLGIGTVTQQLWPVNVVASAPVRVWLNYASGRPASFFTLSGENFPAGSQVTVQANGTVLTTDLTINETGSFIVFLDTTRATPAYYLIIVGVNPSATTTFLLDNQAPLRLIEGGGTILDVPGGTASAGVIYLPALRR